jgi:4-aminobutyrate aminotransferase / (S)-3-amino-2-methylpropionate transaminase / 5-aminovalerate transaminase
MTDRLSTEEKYHRYVNTSCVSGIEPVAFENASGVTVRAQDGTEYLDLFAGISVVNAGHRDPAVVQAAKSQIDRFIHCASHIYYSAPVADLAELLAEITPGPLQKTFFGNSGAEAMEGAMRLAKAYTNREEFIALQMSFHGRTNATLSITGNAARKTHGGPYLPGVALAPAPHPYRCRFCEGNCTLACADAVEDVIRFSTGKDVAAFIAEPLMGEGGIIVPPEGYFERVKEILDHYEILFVVDEVQTGFGRTGKMFGIEHYNVRPDIMAMAKGIADGFPLGAFTAPPQIADSFLPGEHLSTFGGNPVCCAAAIANIGTIRDQQLPEHAFELGSWLMQELWDAAERHSVIGDVRGRGLMIGIELVRDRATKEPAPREAAEVRRTCRERGLLVGVGGQDGNVVRIQPPLVITQEQLSHAIEVLDSALQGLQVSV